MSTCLECAKKLNIDESNHSRETLGVHLCNRHLKLIKNIMARHDTPREAVQLYYGLKEAGLAPMLEWWDGNKSVDVALSRVKLNLEVDTEYQMFTCNQALHTLEERMFSFKDGFTTLRIPHMLIRQCPGETIDAILSIIEGLRARSRAV